MAWEWSHSGEAYEAAKHNLDNLPKETLEIIFAEWAAAETEDDDEGRGFDQEKYSVALEKAKELPDDILADAIWEKASEQALCDNGGFNAWMCPYGCGSHTVSFSFPSDPEDEIDDDEDEE